MHSFKDINKPDMWLGNSVLVQTFTHRKLLACFQEIT